MPYNIKLDNINAYAQIIPQKRLFASPEFSLAYTVWSGIIAVSGGKFFWNFLDF
jgi:hypothetical protein